MKYENLKQATEICKEIEGHEKMLRGLSDQYVSVDIRGTRDIYQVCEVNFEKNEDLKFLATDYRNKVAQYYRNRIESLKTELEKL